MNRVVIACTVVLLLLTTISIMSVYPVQAASAVDVTVYPDSLVGVNQLSLGFQVDQEWNSWSESGFRRQEAENANFQLIRAFDFRRTSPSLMPCTYFNETTKAGVYDWTNVDKFTQRVLSTGAEPLFVLGWARPDIMNYLPPGMAENPLTGLPYPGSYASYAAAWATHFKNLGIPVKYYEIMNEPFKYFGWTPNNTKLGYYKELFNAVAASMRKINADLVITFDFIASKPVLDYWLSNNGADVDAIDFHKYDQSTIGQLTNYQLLEAAENKYFTSSPLGYSVTQARQVWFNARGRYLPIINSESNLNSAYSAGSDPRIQEVVGAAWISLVLREDILNGVNYNIYYRFGSSASYEQIKPTGGSGFGMVNLDNDKPWYPYYAQCMIGRSLGPGDTILKTSSNSSNVRALAWSHKRTVNLLLITKIDQPWLIQLHGLQGSINYSKIDETVAWQTPIIQTGSQQADSPLHLDGYSVILLQPVNTPQSFFEDGFESRNFSSWSGVAVSSEETPVIVDDNPRSGNYSARFNSNDVAAFGSSFIYKNVTASEIYARGYFMVASSNMTTVNDSRFYFIMLKARSNTLAAVGWRLTETGIQWRLVIRDGAGWSIVETGENPTPSRWYDVGLYWVENSLNGHAELYVNGKMLSAISGKDTTAYGEVDTVSFGLPSTYNCLNITTYLDEVLISNRPLSKLLPALDLNQDGKIDIVDTVIVTLAYGATPGSPNWDPRADTDGNSVIDIVDVASITLNYS